MLVRVRSLVRLSLATEVVDNTQTGMHCLKFGSGSTELKMMQQVGGNTSMSRICNICNCAGKVAETSEISEISEI